MNDKTHFSAVVINDDTIQLHLLAELLRKDGIDALAFESAESALSAMGHDRLPDLIITDLHMPGIDGWRLCRLLRSPEYADFNRIPILVVSATFTGDDASNITAEIGADAFLSLPDRNQRFLQTVQALLQADRTTNLLHGQLRILIIEDSRTLAKILQKRFEANGCLVEAFHTIEAGIAAVEAAAYDAAVIDYHLPDGQGDAVLAALRDAQPDCACIMMTTDPDSGLALQWMKMGASAYVRKPFEPAYLMELCVRARKEKALLRVEDLLAKRSRQFRKSEERWRKLIRHSSDIFVIIDPNGIQQYVSPAVERITGYRPEALTGKSLEEIIHPDDMTGIRKAWVRAIDHSDQIMQIEYRHIHKTRGWIRLEAVGQSFINDPLIGGVIASVRDITERKEAEAQRRLHSLVLDQIQDHVTVSDLDGFITYVNHATFKSLGYSRDQLIGTSVLNFGENSQQKATQRKIVEKTVHNGSWRGEVVNQTADGREVVFDCRTQLVFDEQGKKMALCGISTDITERKRAEAEREKLQIQLNHAQKMESIGRLAGGVAHDFNNMLSVILGQTEMALLDVAPSDPLRANLLAIQESAMHSADLTRQLLAFARKQTITPRVLNLNDTIEGMLKMLRRLIGENIHLEWKPAPNLWMVRMDPSQVDQVLANLCVNARDAMTSVGRVEMRTGNVAFDANDCIGHPEFIQGEFVMLSVGDNGCGMDSATQANIFEPFFTTKEAGKGTGLGLSTVYGVVKQNNGFIHTHSEPGIGSEFRIYLPRQTIDLKENGSTETEAPVLAGRETILLVEDEPMVLKINQARLEKLGYTVLAASSPAAALETAKRHPGTIDLLATDVIMPGMNGRQLAAKMQRSHPSLKCLFISGYTSDVIGRQGILEADTAFLQKPFSMKDLASKIREMLEGD